MTLFSKDIAEVYSPRDIIRFYNQAALSLLKCVSNPKFASFPVEKVGAREQERREIEKERRQTER